MTAGGDSLEGRSFVAHASVTISASRARVWDALVNPETMKQYMPVTSVVSQWEVHSTIVWTSEFQGKSFEVKGTVLRFEPERVLEYNHSLPIFRPSGVTHPSENYQRVIIELSDEDGQTRLSVTEQGNTTRRQLEHSEGSWRMVLHGMKALLEGTSVLPLRESR